MVRRKSNLSIEDTVAAAAIRIDEFVRCVLAQTSLGEGGSSWKVPPADELLARDVSSIRDTHKFAVPV